MRYLKLGLGFSIVFVLISASALNAQQTFVDLCNKSYLENSVCPPATCQLQCAVGEAAADCPKVCVPKECQAISAENCPKDFCHTVTDCSQKVTCQVNSSPDQIPECGALGYDKQEVECCPGLVKRCGFDYLDGKCNMQGKNTSYNVPICIPCGNGVCTNFENHCNCPEDCKKKIFPLD